MTERKHPKKVIPASNLLLRTRFAPSPTGLLHVGNGLSALLCQQWGRKHQAECLLRIEDIDHTRCRDSYIQAIRHDLDWLGVSWHHETARQSQRLEDYATALEKLKQCFAVYPCFCTRADFKKKTYETTKEWHCPQRCIQLACKVHQQRMTHEPHAWRLRHALTPPQLTWLDNDGKTHLVIQLLKHDPIIARKDILYSYHLAVVVDDAAQGISHVIRGMDLWDSTAIHRLLQNLLGLPSPTYHHHLLIHDKQGQRLAKQSCSTSLRELQQLGINPTQLRNYLLNSTNSTWPPSNNVTQLTQTA